MKQSNHIANLEQRVQTAAQATALLQKAIIKAAYARGSQPLAIAQHMNLPIGVVKNALDLGHL
jgi:type II secretory pathway component PulJ